MIKRVIKYIISIGGATLGFFIYYVTQNLLQDIKPEYISKSVFDIGLPILFIISFAIIFYILSPYIIRQFQKIANYVQNQILKMPLPELITSIIAFIVSIVVAYLLSNPISKIPFIGIPLAVLIYIFLGYIGINVGRIRKDEISKYIQIKKITTKEKTNKKNIGASPKILDTSVIIDGRISDIIKTGFIEGKIVVPTFVLDELRYIADSADDLKRVRGRHGLDMLNEIQNTSKVVVEIDDTKIEDVEEVDIKLLRLAEKINGCVVTNDYNLNKVAQIQNIKILNINELSNAVKPRLVAGEKIILNIVKEGKDSAQGVGYLDDGTMIVVENGRKAVGTTTEVEVSSILQTPAGRMIFARIKK